MALLLRYDTDEDAILAFNIQRADAEGEPISPPSLSIVDTMTGERWVLTREQAWKLRDLIARMWNTGQNSRRSSSS
jgi:hypothetical protein